MADVITIDPELQKLKDYLTQIESGQSVPELETEMSYYGEGINGNEFYVEYGARILARNLLSKFWELLP